MTHDTELGGEVLRVGEEVFLAYAAGSRDPAVLGGSAHWALNRVTGRVIAIPS